MFLKEIIVSETTKPRHMQDDAARKKADKAAKQRGRQLQQAKLTRTAAAMGKSRQGKRGRGDEENIEESSDDEDDMPLMQKAQKPRSVSRMLRG